MRFCTRRSQESEAIFPPTCLTTRICTFVTIRPWLPAIVVSMGMSLALIERKYGLLFPAFLSPMKMTFGSVSLFVLSAVFHDMFAVYMIVIAMRGISRGLFRASPFTESFLVMTGGLLAVTTVNFINWEIVTYLGDLLTTSAALNVGDGLFGALPHLIDVVQGIFGAVILLIGSQFFMSVIAFCIVRSSGSLSCPPFRAQLKVAVLLAALCVTSNAGIVILGMNEVAIYLRRTSLQVPITRLLARLTDFDGDGPGWIDLKSDFAPFDSQRSPYAIEIPENGIDENNLAGDLIRTRASERAEVAVDVSLVKERPDVFLIVPCTLRADVVFGGIAGPSAMPELLELSRRAVVVEPAYSHSGHTTASLRTLFSGDLISSEKSLMEDFRILGYKTAVFSTRDEMFGNVRNTCKLSSADYYFDATMAIEDKVSRYSAPTSLILSSQRLIREINERLPQHDPKPLFVYVFLAITHFPYCHDLCLDSASTAAWSSYQATPETRSKLNELYRLSARSLDRQISNVLNTLRSKRSSDPVVIIFSDHGESLFDDGMLGHGTRISETQYRVPCIMQNVWADVPVPFGHVHLRDYLLKMLQTPRVADSRVQLMKSSEPLFQYSGTLDFPTELGIAANDGLQVVDLARRQFRGPSGIQQLHSFGPEMHDRAKTVVNLWETILFDGRQ